MLPLWIIDITQHSKRRSRFGELIGTLNGVVKQNELQSFLDGKDSEGVYVRKKQWYYSIIDNTFEGVDPENSIEMADAVYRFQEKVVEEGQNFVKMLRHANVNSSATLNVCVIADVSLSANRFSLPWQSCCKRRRRGFSPTTSTKACPLSECLTSPQTSITLTRTQGNVYY